jgi:hypothetical protein
MAMACLRLFAVPPLPPLPLFELSLFLALYSALAVFSGTFVVSRHGGFFRCAAVNLVDARKGTSG